MKIVVQYKTFKWVNFCDEDGNTRYFDSVSQASDFLKDIHFSRDVEIRICEYLGDRSYQELEPPKSLKKYK